jgi:MFS family permease
MFHHLIASSNKSLDKIPFISFLTANAISLIGNHLTVIAVPWFVLETTGSAAKTGVVVFFSALPAVLAMFFGGPIIDRIGYKRTSVISDICSGLTVVLIPLLYYNFGLRLQGLMVLVFLSALLDAPGNTARSALLPDIARAGGVDLERANAIQQAIRRGTGLIGPVIAGMLISSMESGRVLWLDGGSFAISALIFYLALPNGSRNSAVRMDYFSDIQEGLKFLRQNPLILSLVSIVAITNFLDAPLFSIVIPVYAKSLFGDATKLGIMLAVYGAGAMIGSLVFASIGARLPRRKTFVLSFILVGLPYWILALKPSFSIILISMFLNGILAGPLNPLIMTVMQEQVPSQMRGRVFGLISAGAYIATPLGILLAGYLMESLSVISTISIIAGGYLLVTCAQIFNNTLPAMNKE